MSLTLNMVGGGSGGGISPNSALLVVYTPLGSTVTATNGSATKTSTTDIALSDRPTVGMHLISIPSDQFGTWTVTATRGTDTNSKTITISAVEQYEVYIWYRVPLREYQEVEYIQNTGESWIDTGVSPAINFKCQMRIATASNGDGLFGIYNSGGGNTSYRAEVYASNNKFILYSGVPNSDTAEYPLNHTITFGELYDLEYEQTNNRQILRGFDLTASTNKATASRNMCTFFRYYGKSVYYKAGKLSRAVIYNNGVLVRDMWPCYRISDSVAGMWDNVESRFFTNAGSGSFTVGPDVN